MKVLIFPALVISAVVIVYSYSRHQKKVNKPVNTKVIATIVSATIFLLSFGIYKMYKSATVPDTQCSVSHSTNLLPPTSLITATDYFNKGDYDYETGNCEQAVMDYTKSIELNASYPQAYNNRAYTYMRMQNYKAALADLESALKLSPNYIQALMNRGDIHNFYYEIDRQSAISDYRKVISLGGARSTSVCGHLFMAKHHGWNLGTILDLPRGVIGSCD